MKKLYVLHDNEKNTCVWVVAESKQEAINLWYDSIDIDDPEEYFKAEWTIIEEDNNVDDMPIGIITQRRWLINNIYYNIEDELCEYCWAFWLVYECRWKYACSRCSD